VILAKARELECPVIETEHDYRLEREVVSEGGRFRAEITDNRSGWHGELSPSLAGRFQLRNALTAVAAVRWLRTQKFSISDEAIREGIAEARWPGRLERLQSRPDVYLDGAHNPAAARELASFWRENFAKRNIWLIYGAMRDKAVDEVAGLLFPMASEVILTQPRTSRAISAAQLAEIAGHHANRFSVIADAEEAVMNSLSGAAASDAIFITGSLYLVGQVRHYWKNRSQVAASGKTP
jgi:dihydrofolate synthase/folylpolyglutamate synthase